VLAVGTGDGYVGLMEVEGDGAFFKTAASGLDRFITMAVNNHDTVSG
jgi:hypothetical protein